MSKENRSSIPDARYTHRVAMQMGDGDRIRPIDTDDRGRIIEQGYKYVHAYAKSMNLDDPQAIFRGMSDTRDSYDPNGKARIASAMIEYGLSYITPHGNRGRMPIHIAYANGKYAIRDDSGQIPTTAQQYKEIPAKITPEPEDNGLGGGSGILLHETRGNIIDSIGNYFASHPEQANKFFDTLDPETQNETIKSALDQLPKDELETLAAKLNISTKQPDDSDAGDLDAIRDRQPIEASIRTAKISDDSSMVPMRTMMPINYMAERIARMVELTKREPQNIFIDFVKTSPYLTNEQVEELADKVGQLGYYVTPIKTGRKNHLFSMPYDEIGDNTYLGDDMNEKKFRDRFHKNSPEMKPQERELAGKNDHNRGVFANLLDQMASQDTYGHVCPECDGTLIRVASQGEWSTYRCNRCSHEEQYDIPENLRTAMYCDDCDMEMDVVSTDANGGMNDVTYRCPSCGKTEVTPEAAIPHRDEDTDSMAGQSPDIGFYDNRRPAAPDAGHFGENVPSSGWWTGAQVLNGPDENPYDSSNPGGTSEEPAMVSDTHQPVPERSGIKPGTWVTTPDGKDGTVEVNNESDDPHIVTVNLSDGGRGSYHVSELTPLATAPTNASLRMARAHGRRLLARIQNRK